MINPPLLWVSALFFLALVSVLYLGSWMAASAVLCVGKRRLSHRGVKRILLLALAAPPMVAAMMTLRGAFLRHTHESPLLEHHSDICRQMAGRLSALSGLIGTGAATTMAGIVANGVSWLLLGAGFFLFARVIRATRRLEIEITPYLTPPSPRLARALERMGPALPAGFVDRCYECAVPMGCSSLLGFFRPRCILSRDLIAVAPDDEIASVIAHEAAHLRMGDVSVTLLLAWIHCFFFYLRPVRWMGRRWREEAELAGDAAAAALTGKPLALAEAILRASGAPVAAEVNGRSLPITALSLNDEVACSPAKRVERLIAQAQGSVFPAVESSVQSFGGWIATLGLAVVSVLVFSSASAVCYAHCSLEAVARLML